MKPYGKRWMGRDCICCSEGKCTRAIEKREVLKEIQEQLKMNHWNHRVVKYLKDGKYPCYGVCEVYYDEENKPFSRTDPIDIASFPNPNLGISDKEALKELKETTKLILQAFDAPILNWEDEFPYEETPQQAS